MQTNNDTAPPWHFWSAERKSLCGVPVGYPQRFTDRLADVTCADCRSRMQKVESASTPMQTDETRAREVLGKEAGYGGPIPLEVDGHPIAVTTIAAIRAMLAFAAPPAVERALQPSDREAIARIISPSTFNYLDFYIKDSGEWRAIRREWEGVLAKADAILALSGSLAPANPTERDPA